MVVERIQSHWRRFRSSLLFTPAWLTVAALALFGITTRLDQTEADTIYALLERTGSGATGFLVFTGSSAGALAILQALVGTWATIVGVVFSVTLVTIQLSATKYSAQVIPVFERDRLNQTVLGAFTATFVYSLLVLKTVRTEEGSAFVPLIGINVAILLAILCIFLLIAFIGNLTAYIRPTRFVRDYAERGRRYVPRYNVPREEQGWTPIEGTAPAEAGAPVPAPSGGHLSRIDWDDLRRRLDRMVTAPSRVDVLVPVGQAVSEADTLLRVHGIDADAAKELLGAFVIEPSAQQDDPSIIAETLADLGVTALAGGATDIGVAKGAARGLLDIMAEALRDPRLPQAFDTRVGDRRVVVQRRQEPFHRHGFGALVRIVEKARSEGYRDVGVDILRHSGPVLRRAAGSPAWQDARAWLQHLVDWLRTAEEAGLFERTREALLFQADELERHGHPAAARDVRTMAG